MVKLLWMLVFVCMQQFLHAQHFVARRNSRTDTTKPAPAAELPVYEMPVVTLGETDRSDQNAMYVPSVLHASQDVFLNIASFHFSVVRFRMRGYDADAFSTSVNGMPVNNPDDGNTQWSLWSGLNDVTRNSQLTLALQPGEHSFGNLGNHVAIDMRASKQRVQNRYSYSFGNRAYTHRWMFSTTTPVSKRGWAFSCAASWRIADEGYMPGTDYRSFAYYAALDKRVSDHLLSLVFFGNQTTNAKQGPVLKESVALAQQPFYNPYWGYQSGRKRNANIGYAHQPVVVLIDEIKPNNYTSLTITAGWVAGKKSSTALDWYRAPDPRPDYYRYLPSYQSDSLLREQVYEKIHENKSILQVNWDHLYEINRNSFESVDDADGITGNRFTGLRAHYLLEERVADLMRAAGSAVLNTRVGERWDFSAGASYLFQESRYYKKVNDLLGATYTVDWNQFAERDFPNDSDAMQNDLNRPNRILYEGDRYGYDYSMLTTQLRSWVQLATSHRKYDAFAAIQFAYTHYLRDGHVRNGLFPDHSFGRSEPNEFTNMAGKAGMTYKFNGRRYGYVHVGLMDRAPLFDNVYLSPRTGDMRQDVIQSERMYTAEAGFVWNAPKFRMRVSLYGTSFRNGMNVISFYHDGYANFVNYALGGIDKIHYGTELGIECQLTKRISFNAAASIGRYYFTSRPYVIVRTDNDAYVLQKTLIYQQHYRIGGTPQEAYGSGLSYRSANGACYLSVTGNFFREHWLGINPLRRTYEAVENVAPGSAQWEQILAQEKLPDQYTVDLSGGTSFRVRLVGKQKHFIMINVSVGNLFNRKDIISGGYEQMRFDVETKNIDKFPPKYFYAPGLNFSINCSVRL